MSHPRSVVIAGANGFLGERLSAACIARGYAVTALVRRPMPAAGGVRTVLWDGTSYGAWANELEHADAVVNLVGRSVNCVYTETNRREILSSRVNSVRAIAEAVARCKSPPRAWVQAGSLAIYGDPGNRVCDEESPHGTGFSVDVCTAWEQEFQSAAMPGTRKVLLRIGLALGSGNGIMKPFSALAKCFLGGTVGRGTQYLSWLHVDDLNEMFLWSIEREDVVGVYNATGPEPVTNREFMWELRRACDRPWSPPVPKLMVRFGARWVMRTEAELALAGRACVPARFLQQGFRFRYPEVGAALDACVS